VITVMRKLFKGRKHPFAALLKNEDGAYDDNEESLFTFLSSFSPSFLAIELPH